MDNIEILYKDVASGKLVFPLDKVINQISLSKILQSFVDQINIDLSTELNKISTTILQQQHLIFFLADGFGMNFLNKLNKNSFLVDHFWNIGCSVFPSSTGPNLLSLATGKMPGEHGDLGWETYITKISDNATLFKWERSKDNERLSSLGLTLDDIYLEEPFIKKNNIDYLAFVPEHLKSSPTTNWITNGKISPYDDLSNALKSSIDRINNSKERTFTFIYWPDIDFYAHKTGANSSETMLKVNLLDDYIYNYYKMLPKNTAFILTSDHGHLDARDKRIKLSNYDELLKKIHHPISGEQRFAFLRLEEERESFYEIFKNEFGDHFYLFDSKEICEKGLIGKNINEIVFSRIGDSLILSKDEFSFDFSKSYNNLDGLFSDHGGLTSDEMDIPIIFYNT